MPAFGAESHINWYRQLFAITAAVFIALTALAAYAWSSIHALSLAVSPALSVIAVVVPLLNLTLLTHLYPALTRRTARIALPPTAAPRPLIANPRVNFATVALLLLDTVLITLSATHMPAASNACALDAVWLRLFRGRDAATIKQIQDALDCCGFNTVQDRPFPFPRGKEPKIPSTACRDTFHRAAACRPRLQAREQAAAGILVAVGAAVAAVKVVAYLIAYYRAVQAERRGLAEGAREEGERLAEDARQRIEDVSSDAGDREENGNGATEGSMLLPAAVRNTPWGDEGVEERRETLI